MIDSEALLGHQEYPVLSPIHLLWSNPLTLCVGSNRVIWVAETQSFTTTFLRIENCWTHVSKTRRSTLSTARSKTHVKTLSGLNGKLLTQMLRVRSHLSRRHKQGNAMTSRRQQDQCSAHGRWHPHGHGDPKAQRCGNHSAANALHP